MQANRCLVFPCVLAAAAFHIALAAAATSPTAADELQEVLVTAVLRPQTAGQLPQSVTELGRAQLQQSGVQHFGDVLALVPNLTAAGGTSRPRYFQIRGVGEEEQYQGAPNPAVGFLIDGIDFSGVGMPATLFDVQAIDVLRGPQSSAYGANALAGLISVQTRDPLDGADAHGEVTVGDYATRAAGVAFGDGGGIGAGEGRAGWRVVAQQYRSDGFRHDVFLHRDDTNNLDEGTLRARLAWQPDSAWRVDLTLMHVNLDNGYDAWSIDNTRNTQSDKPGKDAQRSDGGALRLRYAAAAFGEWQSLTSAADSHILFSYDGDWGNNAFWAQTPACRPDPSLCVPYDYTSATQRERRTVAEDLRLVGDDAHRLFGRARWLVGAYALRLTETNSQFDLYNGAPYITLDSDYRADNTALYGQLDAPLTARSSLTLGLRGEQRHAHYRDSNASAFDPVNKMWGGNFSWQFDHSDTSRSYATLARGFRAGGFNIGPDIPLARREFQPEYLWNLELGHKAHSSDGAWQWQADVFYMRRVNQQVSSSVQSDPTDPLTYQFYTDNAARGENYGLEAQGGWQVTPGLRLGGTLGLLATRYIGFAYNVVSYDAAFNPTVVRRDLSGRAQEYAPPWQTTLAVDYQQPLRNYRHAHWLLHIDAARMAGYYFSASHDQRAAPHGTLNARLGVAGSHWETTLWVRNLLDSASALHGFYFGNEPPDFPNKLYLEQGEPRQVGVTVRYALNAP